MVRRVLSLPLRLGVYFMLLLSAGVCLRWGDDLWLAFQAGQLPLWAPLFAPAIFFAFLLVYCLDRFVAVRHQHYPAARAMLQIGFGLLFLTLLLPYHRTQDFRQEPELDTHAESLEASLILLSHPDHVVRQAACDVVHGRVSAQVLARVKDDAHNDSDPRVRQACEQALSRLHESAAAVSPK